MNEYKPLTEEEIDKILERNMAIIKGHFVYAAGGHGDVYIDKDKITVWPSETATLCKDIAWRCRELDIEAVVGPAIGGIKLSDRTAEWLGFFTGKVIPSLYTEKDEYGTQTLKRNRGMVADKRTLIVEDIINTGGSAKDVVSTCQKAGAIVVACCALVNRSPGIVTAEKLGVPVFEVLKEMEVANYPKESCPLCAGKTPISTEVGHGTKYLEEHPEKKGW